METGKWCEFQTLVTKYCVMSFHLWSLRQIFRLLLSKGEDAKEKREKKGTALQRNLRREERRIKGDGKGGGPGEPAAKTSFPL